MLLECDFAIAKLYRYLNKKQGNEQHVHVEKGLKKVRGYGFKLSDEKCISQTKIPWAT